MLEANDLMQHLMTYYQEEEAKKWLLVVEEAKKNPKIFLKFCKTLDEHDSDNPIKFYPIDEKKYLSMLVDVWMSVQLLLVEKSRQMMVTWTFLLLYLWDTMFLPGRKNFVISKKETDADALLDRAKFTFNELPIAFRLFAGDTHQKKCHLKLIDGASEMIAVSQEAEALRQFTASGIFSDELAFQPLAGEAFLACKPTIDGGGRFTGVSTPAGKNFFYRLVKDTTRHGY